MKSPIKYISILFLSSYIFYRFYFNFISISIQQILFFGILISYMIFNMGRMRTYFNKLHDVKVTFNLSILLYSLIAASSLFIPIIYKTYDFSYMNSFIRTLTYLVSYVVLLDIIHQVLRPNNLKEEFMRLFIFSSQAYVAFSVATLISPNFKVFWQSIIYESERNLNLLNNNPHYLTRFGWTGFSNFSVSFSMTIAFIFANVILIQKWNSKQSIDKPILISLPVLLLGGAFYGRIGLVAMLFITGITLIYLTERQGKIHYFVYTITAMIGLFILFTLTQFLNPTLAYWYRWIMEPVTNLFTTGKLTTTSTQGLFDMYIMPSMRTFLLGDGYYTSTLKTGYYMSVDIGFLRPLLFFGFGNVMISYGVSLFLLKGLHGINKSNLYFVMLIFLTLILFEIKGEVNLALIPLLFTLLLAEAESTNNKMKKEVNYE